MHFECPLKNSQIPIAINETVFAWKRYCTIPETFIKCVTITRLFKIPVWDINHEEKDFLFGRSYDTLWNINNCLCKKNMGDQRQ